MQGLWKTKISGYKKDNKRKSTTTKQFIRDKKSFIEKEILKLEERKIQSDVVNKNKNVLTYQNVLLERENFKAVSKIWMLGGEFKNDFISRKIIKMKIKNGDYEIIDKTGHHEFY